MQNVANEDTKYKLFNEWLQHNGVTQATSQYCNALRNYDASKYRLKTGELFSTIPELNYSHLLLINDATSVLNMYTSIKGQYEIYAASTDRWRDDHNTLSAALKKYAAFLSSNGMESTTANIAIVDNTNLPSRNTIWYGAPGTGKSYQLNELLKDSFADRYERVTFYADYLHSQFVGSYKPITVANTDTVKQETGAATHIEYRFRPGPFTRVLIQALNHPGDIYALVIEELNRAEAASVFGDVFQLLDRNKDGRSEYAISVSEDLREYLETDGEGPNYLTEDGRTTLGKLTETDDCSQIVIPNNMYILATMNSADQGVFPLDTAFKRRWDFEYVSIDAGENATDKNGERVVKDKKWATDYRHTINENLLDAGIPEDKQMGPFFLGNANDSVFGDDAFDKAMKNKVIMYLFEDAARYRPEIVFDLDTIGATKDSLSLSKLFKAWDDKDHGNYGIFKGLDTQTKPTRVVPDNDDGNDGSEQEANGPSEDPKPTDSADQQTENNPQ